MSGYYVPGGFRGLVEGKYVLFASEADYADSYVSQTDDE